jgi:hypothetical protein
MRKAGIFRFFDVAPADRNGMASFLKRTRRG